VPPVTFVGSLLYTIPSVAAFEILVTITGINDVTVEIALVSYTLLILFTNTLAGLSAVSPDVVDAARGTGLTDTQILLRVELPLAVPTIIAGLRVAVVTIISLATVAALIVPEGLGKPIFDALGAGVFNTKFIASGVLCIFLALFADALFVGVQRVLTPWASARRTR
jgi:osmoprotectant transport system permease protein